jgi:hypothetical protein
MSMKKIIFLYFLFLSPFTQCALEATWIKQFGANSAANSVATDSNNNVYITGYTDIGLDSNTSAGGRDVFLVKYDASGTKVWTKQFGSTSLDSANSVTVDSNNNIYVAGYTNGSFPLNTSAGSNDAFLVKFDDTGDRKWIKQFGTTFGDSANSVTTDSNNNIYVAGSTGGVFSSNTSAGSNDAFLVKFDDTGDRKWIKQFGTTGSDSAR